MPCISEQEVLHEWISDKTKKWAEATTALSKACAQFPQSAFTGLSESLQHKWQCVQRVRTWDPSSRALKRQSQIPFSPVLFGKTAKEFKTLHPLTFLPVKFAGSGPRSDASEGFCRALGFNGRSKVEGIERTDGKQLHHQDDTANKKAQQTTPSHREDLFDCELQKSKPEQKWPVSCWV